MGIETCTSDMDRVFNPHNTLFTERIKFDPIYYCPSPPSDKTGCNVVSLIWENITQYTIIQPTRWII